MKQVAVPCVVLSVLFLNGVLVFVPTEPHSEGPDGFRAAGG